MNNIKTWLICILMVTLQISSASAAQVLKAVPEKVKFGTFNTFQITEAVITLKNTGRKTFLIDKIKANCSCVRTRIDSKEIAAGKSTELTVAAMQRIGGKFSHSLLIIPEDKEHYEPLMIQTTGNVVQPVSAKIGWIGKTPKALNTNVPMRLGLVHQLSAKPVIYITANDEHFNLRGSVPDVNSVRFELEDYKFEKPPPTDQIKTGDKRKEILVLRLKPKKMLKIGVLRDFIRVKLTDDVKFQVPIVCRIVGDAYPAEQMINLGTLSNSGSKELSIYFTNDTKTWEDIKWSAKCYLSKAIVINKDRSKCADSCIRLTLSVNRSELSHLPKGYLFCRMKFYQDEPTDNDVVSVLVDGFNY